MKDCLNFFERHKVAKVLDLGCGIGLWSVYLSKAGMRVKGVDFSINAIDFGTRWARRENLSIEFRCAPVTELAFPEDKFVSEARGPLLRNSGGEDFGQYFQVRI